MTRRGAQCAAGPSAGYQCSNYYRGLVKNGDVVDTNYMVDDKGQMRFNFKNKGFERPEKGEGEGAGEGGGTGEGEDGVCTNSQGEVGHYVATKAKAPRAPPKPKAPKPKAKKPPAKKAKRSRDDDDRAGGY